MFERRLALNLVFFFLCSKAFSRIIFGPSLPPARHQYDLYKGKKFDDVSAAQNVRLSYPEKAGFHAKSRLKNEPSNSILMMYKYNYPDLGSYTSSLWNFCSRFSKTNKQTNKQTNKRTNKNKKKKTTKLKKEKKMGNKS